ncbi:MAG: hypothetical protein K6G29_03700 [Clostridiales bacterium]|nr:hypothetical protein [Clostridiales bacterium]
MINWWNSMDTVGQIFALIAIPSTLVLVVQTVLLLFGLGGAADGIDIDGDGIPDTPGFEGDGDSGLALFSLRGIMSMAAVAGWSGLVMHEAEMPLAVTVLLAAAFGFLAMVAIAFVMKLAMKLQQNGNLDIGYAIGKVGTVYIPIPASMKGSGKINLTIQERFIEIDAKTRADRKLTTGESVKIVATDPTGLVIVEPLESE